MAYMDQTRKAKLAGGIKEILAKYGVKGSLSVRHHSTLVLNIKSGPIDFIANCNETCSKDSYQVSRGFTPITDKYMDVNEYHYDKHFSGAALSFLTEIIDAMTVGNWDKSDIQTDFFDVGWYIDINIGKWDRAYIVEA